MSADMALDTDGVLRSKIIEMKRSGIEMSFSVTITESNLYEVLKVQTLLNMNYLRHPMRCLFFVKIMK